MFGDFWDMIQPMFGAAGAGGPGSPGGGGGGAGDYGPGGYEGWQPWARSERDEPGRGGPGRGRQRGRRHERDEWYGGPEGGPEGGPWWRGPWEENQWWGPMPGTVPGPMPGPGPRTWHFSRRFPFGPGMGPGPRMFGRGDLKYALLDLLRERPKHGYEMIKDLEERSGGFYSPSAGAIYPTLQLLEDRGWVTSETQEGKKVYAISDSGRAALAEFEQRVEQRAESFGGPPPWAGHHRRGPFGRGPRPELRDLRREGGEVLRLMRASVMVARDDPERLKQLQAIVERSAQDLRQFLGQTDAPRGQGPQGPDAPPPPPGEGPVEHL